MIVSMRGIFLKYKKNNAIQKMALRSSLIFGFILLFLFPFSANAAFTFNQSGVDDLGDATSDNISEFEVFGDYLYACVINAGGIQVWRSDDPANNGGVAASSVWTKVATGGFGDSTNALCSDMEVFNGQLYVSTRKEVDPGELWRTSDGIIWTQVGSDGFGDANNFGIGELASFDGRLYANTVNVNQGSEVWRSDTSGNNFALVAITDNGFGDALNTETFAGVVFDGQLYFSTYNLLTGGEVWRSSNGTSWSQVNADGFGDVNNATITDMALFQNDLYLSTENGITGGELWKTATGNLASYSQIAGITELGSTSIQDLHVRNRLLFLTTSNFATGSKVWSTPNGAAFTQQNMGGFGDASYYVTTTSGTFNGVTVFSASTAGGAFKLFYPDLSPTISNVVALQRNDGTGYVDISFDISTPDGADTVEGLVQYDVGAGFNDTYLIEDTAATTATQGDPSVLNTNSNQIGNASAHVLTSGGTNTISTIWNSKRDNANVSQNNTVVRIRGFSGTDGAFSSSVFFPLANSDLVAPITSASSAGGVYQNGQSVVLTCADGLGAGCDKTYYTVNGTMPTVTSAVYSGPISIAQSAALKYFSVDFAGNQESVKTELYTITSNGPALRMVKTVLSTSGARDGQSIQPGDVLTYFVDYQNLGQNSATGVLITDSIPGFTSYKSGSIVLNGTQLTDIKDGDAADVGVSHKNNITLDIGTVPAGATGRFSFQVTASIVARSGDIVSNEARGQYNPFNLSVISNQTQNTIAATGELGGSVFNDLNKNGVFDSFESGVSGVTVRIFDDNNRNGVIDAGDTGAFIGTTDGNGNFKSTGMSAGFYMIQVDQSSISPLFSLTTGNNPGQAVLKDSLQSFTKAHFGFNRRATGIGTVIKTILGGPTTSISQANLNANTAQQNVNIPFNTNLNVSLNLNTSQNQKSNEAENVNAETVNPEDPDVLIDPMGEQPVEDVSFLSSIWQDRGIQSVIQYGIAPLVAVAALINMISMISVANTLWPFLKYLSHAFTEPLRFFGIRKTKNWGRVYNSLTKEPVDLAIVRLFNQETKKLIESFITDSKGRYYFLAEPGREYYLSVTRDGFTFPSQMPLDLKKKDSVYPGGAFSFIDGKEDSVAGISTGGVVSFEIPIDPEVGVTYLDDAFRKPVKTAISNYASYNALSEIERAAENKKMFRAIRIQKISKFFAYLGPLFGLVAFIFSPSVWTGVLLVVHIILFLLVARLAAKRVAAPWGSIFDAQNGKNVSKTIVRLFDPKFGRLLHTRITTSNGRYGFLVGNQDYILVPEHSGYHYPDKKLDIAPQNGIIKEDIGLNKKK